MPDGGRGGPAPYPHQTPIACEEGRVHGLARHQGLYGFLVALQLRHQRLLALRLGGAFVVEHPPACHGVICRQGTA